MHALPSLMARGVGAEKATCRKIVRHTHLFPPALFCRVKTLQSAAWPALRMVSARFIYFTYGLREEISSTLWLTGL
jgi:hypothetical protein